MTTKNSLKTNLNLHPSVSEFVDHLNTTRKMYQDIPAKNLVTPVHSVEDAEAGLQLRISNIEHMARLLMVAPQEDETLIEIVEKLNIIYKELLEIKKTTGKIPIMHTQEAIDKDPKLKQLYERKAKLEGQLIDKESERNIRQLLGERLKRHPIEHALDKLREGRSYQARLEMLVVTHEFMREALAKVANTPDKKARDEKLEEIERSLLLYKHLTDKTWQKETIKNLTVKAEEIAKGPELDKMRALMKQGKDKMQDFTIDGMSLIFGGSEESMLIALTQKAIEMERSLNDLPDYSEVVKEVLKDLESTLDHLSDNIDTKVLDETFKIIGDLKSHPHKRLTRKQKQKLNKQFQLFLDEVVFPVQKNILNISETLNWQSYIDSHGKDSMYEYDGWRKIAQVKGIDLIRAMQVFSPFGVILPDNVELKPFEKRFASYDKSMKGKKIPHNDLMYILGDEYLAALSGVNVRYISFEEEDWGGQDWDSLPLKVKKKYFKVKGGGNIDSIKIKSYWNTGFWKDHELLSLGAQTSLGYLALRTVPAITWHTMRLGTSISRGLGLRMVPKMPGVMPKWFRSGGRALGWAWLGYELGDWINCKIIESMSEETLETIDENTKKYGAPPQWPKNIQNNIRKELLEEAVIRRRGYFQNVGINLGQWWGRKKKSRWYQRKTMYEDGSLEEAFKETNYILNMMGLENFNLDDF